MKSYYTLSPFFTMTIKNKVLTMGTARKRIRVSHAKEMQCCLQIIRFFQEPHHLQEALLEFDSAMKRNYINLFKQNRFIIPHSPMAGASAKTIYHLEDRSLVA
jgi:hypothetical protein